jgi:DNA invertase Pin-like site-specific DNA recombinase
MNDTIETNQNSARPCRYALYVRVSTDKQSNDNQKIRLLQYCKEKNMKFDLFEEVMTSRKTRPVKEKMLQKLRNGEYKGLIIFKLDRLARSATELLLNVEEFLNKNIEFISISDNLDFSSAVGQLHFQILSAFCQFERALIAERTREGLVRAKLQGRKLGRPPGKKDSKPRRRSGYILRQALKKQEQDQKNGIHQAVEFYIDNR